jgi:TP901 family phage tail tape measure protein
LNAFKLPASDAGRVADILAASANASSIEVTDMAMSFQMASAVFASNGQSIEDLATATALLGNNGIKASDAGTSLKAMLIRLTAPVDAAKDVMDDLGIAVYNTDGSMRSFEDIVYSLQDATKGLSDEQRNQALTTIFGADAIRAANILIGEGAESWQAMETAVTEAGAAQLVADAKMKGLSGSLRYAAGTIQSTLINAFLPFTDMLSSLVRRVADLIGSFTDLPAGVQKAVIVFGLFLAAIGPILLALPLIGSLLAALLSPIGLIGIAVAALAAAWVGDFWGIQERTKQAITALEPAFKRIREWFELIKAGNWSGLADSVFMTIGEILRKASATIAAFNWSDWIENVLAWGKYIAGLVWTAFVTKLQSWADYISAIDWGGYITKLTDWSKATGAVVWSAFITKMRSWGDYITAIDWGALVVRFTDWASKITGIDLTGYVTKLADWAKFVSKLRWADFVNPLNWALALGTGINWETKVEKLVWAEILNPIVWASYIVPLAWGTVATAIKWSDWLTAFTWDTAVRAIVWATFVDKLKWSDYVVPLLWASPILVPLVWKDFVKTFRWNTFILSLIWDTYVVAIDWAQWLVVLKWNEFVTKFNEWMTYIKELKWSDFVEVFKWPTVEWPGWLGNFIEKFVWPTLTNIDWGQFIPHFSWPTIPEFPGWGAFFGGLGIPGFAVGTNYAPGGMAIVGERGPELINLPKGSKVHTANSPETQNALNGGGGNGATTIYNLVANYGYQSPGTLADDITLLQMMAA